MSIESHHDHGGHELEDFSGHYAVWAVPFSLFALFVFLLIVAQWVPAAVSHEMRVKELQGAEAGEQSLREHRAYEAELLAARDVSVDRAMQALSRNGSSSTP